MTLLVPSREIASMCDPSTPAAASIRCASLDLLQFEFLRATERAALSCIPWIGRGDKISADAAAVDAIREVFAAMDMRGEIILGEGIKDEAPGLFHGEKVGRWRDGSPRVDIAIDPLDGTTNISKGLPNSISCIAAAIRQEEDVPALQFVPAFYMRKLAYSPAVSAAQRNENSSAIHLSSRLTEVIGQTAAILRKNVRDVVVMCLDRPRNQMIIDEVRESGALLRLIADGDILAALGPAMLASGIDLYVGIGGGPEALLAAVGLRCLGGEMQAQMWPRDFEEVASLKASGWGDRIEKVYRSCDLAPGENAVLAATGVSDAHLLRGVRIRQATATTHSLLMRSHSSVLRYVETEHRLDPRAQHSGLFDAKHLRCDSATFKPERVASGQVRKSDVRLSGIVLFGAPGCGKGTIGKALHRMQGFMHLSSGDLIRAAMAEKAVDGRRWAPLAHGELISDADLWKLFDSYLDAEVRNEKANIALKRLVIDGVPRSQLQVHELAKRIDVRAVLHLQCDDVTSIYERLLRRSILEGRVDDASQQVVKNRLRIFDEVTLPILAAYPSSIVYRIDASLPPDQVLAAVLARVNQLN